MMLFFKKAFCILSVLSIALTLCGCWNNRPITHLAIVIGLGFDKAPDGNILLTAQIVIPSKLSGGTGTSGSQTGGDATLNVTVKGQTSFDAARNLLTKLNRKAYFAHVQLLVFGSDFSKEGINTVWDFMERDNEFSRTMRVAVVKNSTAQALLQEKADIKKLNAIEIEDTLDSSTNFGKSIDIKSFELTELLSKPNTGIVTGLVDLEGSGELSNADVEGAAVLKHAKLVGYFNPDETRGYLFAMNKIQSTILVIPNPEEKSKKISLEVIRSTGTVNATMENGKPFLSIDVKSFGNIGDEQGSTDLFSETDFRKIEEEASALIRSNIDDAVVASQKRYDCDVFNFNDLLYQQYYSEYQKISGQWDTIYGNAQISVSVQFHLDRSGMIKAPAFNP